MARKRARHILDRHKKMKSEKDPWLSLYQLIGEYVMSRKQSFTGELQAGQFLTDQRFDGTAGSANHIMASAFIGALWPSGGKSFRIKAPKSMRFKKQDLEDVKKYYEFVSETLADIMDHPRAGFQTAYEEYMLDKGAFGISGLGTFEKDDYDYPVCYKSTDVKQMTVDENNEAFIDVVFIEKEMTIRQAVQEYGEENLSKETREAWHKGNYDEKIKILHAIEPRIDGDPFAFGNADMPIASIHIEVKSEKIIKESGFTEMPVSVSRFWKVTGEKYGRSPAMEALPDILEMNAIREASIVATEKYLDPPLAVFDDGGLGGGTIDTSAGAINVFSYSGRLGNSNQAPIERLVTTGEMDTTYTRMTELREVIRNHFFVDRLLDLNNESRMTLGEANIRNELRGQSLGSIYSREFGETLVPTIERTFNIALRKGLLGVIEGSPEEQELLEQGVEPFYIPQAVVNAMLKGREVYAIEFISPAARIIQAEELMGIQRTTEYALGTAALVPDILDNIDWDTTLRRVQELTGAPSEMMNALDITQKIREARAEQQQRMAELAAAKESSETARNVAQAGQMSEAA